MSFKPIFILICATTLFVSCNEKAKNEVKRTEVAFEKEGDLSIFKNASDSLITKLDIEIADNEYETQTGLMYRSSMETNQGMLFVFATEEYHSFYMKNTQFPLDLIFIKKDLSIGSFQENAQAFNENSLPSKVPVQYVLEVNAGLVAQWQLEVGDKIEFTKN